MLGLEQMETDMRKNWALKELDELVDLQEECERHLHGGKLGDEARCVLICLRDQAHR